MKIKAAVVREKSGPFLIEEVDLEEPREGEVLVRIAGSGLCHTDLVARDQYLPVPLPAVFGHEGSGVVEQVGARVTKVKPGDHVTMSYLSCGQCPACTMGHPSHCPSFFPTNFSGTRIDGSTTMKKDGQPIYGSFFNQSSFASHVLANEGNVVKVPPEVPLELLGPLGCGVQAGAGGVMNTLRPEVGSSLAVFGVGSVGQSAILAAVAVGCTTIIAVDVKEERLKAAQTFGATHLINSTKTDSVEEIRKITGDGVAYSLECTGLPPVFRMAVDVLMMGGVCGLIGVAPPGVDVNLEMKTILDARTIKGIVMGDSNPDIFIPRLIALYQGGRFPFDQMITFYPLEEINQAAEDSEKGRVLKAVLRP